MNEIRCGENRSESYLDERNVDTYCKTLFGTYVQYFGAERSRNQYVGTVFNLGRLIEKLVQYQNFARLDCICCTETSGRYLFLIWDTKGTSQVNRANISRFTVHAICHRNKKARIEISTCKVQVSASKYNNQRQSSTFQFHQKNCSVKSDNETTVKNGCTIVAKRQGQDIDEWFLSKSQFD